MYPAELYGIDYEFEDLPNSVVWTNSGFGEFVYQKLDEPTYGGNVDGVILYKSGAAEIGSGDENVLYILENVNWTRWTGGSIGGPGICLINALNGQAQGSDAFEDNFLDSYTVYVNGIADVFDETFTVVRRSLCVWSSGFDEGEPSGVILTSPQSFSEKWALTVGGESQAKDDPQNSPIGLYGDQGTEVS